MIAMARPQIGPEEEEAVLAVLRSGRLAQGPQVERFEAAFATVCGQPLRHHARRTAPPNISELSAPDVPGPAR